MELKVKKPKSTTNKCIYIVDGHNIYVSKSNNQFILNCKKNKTKIVSYVFEKELFLVIDNSLIIFNYETKNNDYYLTGVVNEYFLNNLNHRETLDLLNEFFPLDIATIDKNYDIQNVLNKINRVYDIFQGKIRRIQFLMKQKVNDAQNKN